MTKTDYFHILLILDSSGSMQDLQKEVNSGIKLFLDKQREVPGQCTISIYQFNHVVQKLVDFSPLNLISNPQISPTGFTALCDAVMEAFNETGTKLSKMPEKDRPSRVLVTILTDGIENASKKYDFKAVKSAIDEQRSKYNWQIDFFGCDEKCMENAKDLGISKGFQYSYDKSSEGMKVAFSNMAVNKSSLRSCSIDKFHESVQNGTL